jgi:hypothetical protein
MLWPNVTVGTESRTHRRFLSDSFAFAFDFIAKSAIFDSRGLQ